MSKIAVKIENEDQYLELLVFNESLGFEWAGGCKSTEGTPYERATFGYSKDNFYVGCNEDFTIMEDIEKLEEDAIRGMGIDGCTVFDFEEFKNKFIDS